MKKILAITLSLLLAFSGVAYGAVSYKLYLNGKQSNETPIVVKGKTYVPLSTLNSIGIKTSNVGGKVTIDLPAPKVVTKVVEAPRKPLSADDIKLLANRAVAHIIAVDDQGKAISQGSGFVVRSDGLLLTAFHVAEEKGIIYSLKVILNGKEYLIPKGKYLYADKDKDYYLAKLPDGLYDYIPFNDEPLKEKDVVIALGYPKGVADSSSGNVLAQRSEKIWLNMFVDHGMSGGAVITQYGEAVGIVLTGGDPVLRTTSAVGSKLISSLINP